MRSSCPSSRSALSRTIPQLTTTLGMLLLLALLADAGNPYCTEDMYFWHEDGTSSPGGPDWSTLGNNSAFIAGPCLMLSGIGTTETYQKKMLIIDRSNAENGYMRMAGMPQYRAYAVELDLETGQQRPLDTLTNTFCSSGQHLPNGSFLSIGGDWTPQPNYVSEGEFSLRTFSPCSDGTCGFHLAARLARSRWYPTAALLADGRVIIVGGSNTGVGLTTAAANNPFIEYYPKQKGADGASFDVPLLKDALPYNLFPFVHLLPTGKVFIFASHKWTLWDTTKNSEIPGVYPDIVAVDPQGNPIRFSYPTAATSALFPLSSSNGYAAEVMICGGTATAAIQFVNGKTVDNANYPASGACFRIVPEAPVRKWVPEKMQLPRVMPMGVLLPDGHLAILGGARAGHSGLGKLAHKPALLPELYNTQSHTWYPGALPPSKIPRTYHASALIIHDGSVFISGSNPNTEIVKGRDDFPTEFRTEFFQPPYMMNGVTTPVLISAPRRVQYGSVITIVFKYTAQLTNVKVVAVHPGFSTHSGNHGMRNVQLDVRGPMKSKGVAHAVTAVVPHNRNLLPPTWYWVFLVVNGIPNREGHYVFVRGGGQKLHRATEPKANNV